MKQSFNMQSHASSKIVFQSLANYHKNMTYLLTEERLNFEQSFAITTPETSFYHIFKKKLSPII